MLTFAIPCLFGLEGLVGDELRRLGLQDVRVENGRVLCCGTLADLPRLNINLRCAERVLILLASFPARSFEALYQRAAAVPWEEFIPRDGRFPVKGYALDSQLHSVPDCQKIVNKAAADRLGRAYGLQRLPETGAKYQIQFAIMRDHCSLYLDTTGPGLHKRGYRAVGVEAPLRETLAAAMVTLSRYRGKDPFRDPFCGSGTIAIEAALIAKNRAPGLDRSFDAQRWACVDSRLWLDAAGEAMDREYDGSYDIWGGDIDPKAVRIAQENAVKAGVEDLVRFETADAAKLSCQGEYGQIVTNPPYGERLLEKEEAEGLYRMFGRVYRDIPPRWRVLVITSHPEFERFFGRKADKKRKLYNGMIKCDLYQFSR
ncbi:MAG: class I SAM-dependent RNA methyltransferase [Oscillospiraceae bacterium]|nr:class I SAM-dependent RNA methyltransferase [Oscillospiraceae bacterium]